jgi:hypothetical protein
MHRTLVYKHVLPPDCYIKLKGSLENFRTNNSHNMLSKSRFEFENLPSLQGRLKWKLFPEEVQAEDR